MLYHGSDEKQMPNNLEWLAFEVEHAESFARLWQGKVSEPAASPRRQLKDAAGTQIPLRPAGGTAACDRVDRLTEAYFHTYTATHDLKLLLVDGMSAADGDAGAMEMWYTLHLGTNSATWNDDGELVDGRGPGDGFKPPPETDACAIAADMGFAGYIRLEMGFEVIYCNFTDGGLTQTFVKRQVPLQDRLVEDSSRIYQWARAASQPFDGIGGGRVRLDFSSMISGFFFDFDILDPTAPEASSVRLKTAGIERLKSFQRYIFDTLRAPGLYTVDWQGVVDMITSRFADRLAAMAMPALPSKAFMQEVDAVAMQYLAADLNDERKGGNRTTEAVERCTNSYLLPALVAQDRWSLADSLTHSSIKTVMHRICSDYFVMHRILADAAPPLQVTESCSWKSLNVDSELEAAVARSRKILHNLMQDLSWTGWRKPRVCAADESLFTAMYPFGADQDHWDPGCRSATYFDKAPHGFWEYD